MNWRDMLSMISSPEPLSSQLWPFCPLQVGASGFLPLDAEEVKVRIAVPSTRITAVIKRKFSFFMVVVLLFDAIFSENVTANLKIVAGGDKHKQTNSRFRVMECLKCPVNCPGLLASRGQVHLSIFAGNKAV